MLTYHSLNNSTSLPESSELYSMLTEEREETALKSAAEEVILALVYRWLDVAFLIADCDPLFYHLWREVRDTQLHR